MPRYPHVSKDDLSVDLAKGLPCANVYCRESVGDQHALEIAVDVDKTVTSYVRAWDGKVGAWVWATKV